jgi:alpha-beta hydrolase superfamily lysophospholipase
VQAEPDELGPDYEAIRLPMADDFEGEVVATLVRRRGTGSRRAVLYIHGFADYFFQTHLADFYVDRGFDFYALDLRKYGRSTLAHQTPAFARSMSDYFPEIDEAVRIIRQENDVLLINGHSTGGLIAALWADRVHGQGLVDGLFLNSPFFEINSSAAVRMLGGPVAKSLAAAKPTFRFPAALGGIYGRSLHRDHDGEWDYNLTWKPVAGFPIRAGWLAAIVRAQKHLHSGLAIDVPVLVMSSNRTFTGSEFSEEAFTGDAVLNADDIARWAPALGRHVTVVRIADGMHDLVLSRKPARDVVFAELDTWISAYLTRSQVASA